MKKEISVLLDVEVARQLKLVSLTLKTTPSNIVNQAVKRYLEELIMSNKELWGNNNE